MYLWILGFDALENVSNICSKKLNNFNYSYGSSKIVVDCGSFVIKKVFGKLHSDENNIYRKAKEKKLNKFFATTLKYSDDIYIQRKIDIALNDFVKKEKDEGRIIKYGALREDRDNFFIYVRDDATLDTIPSEYKDKFLF